MDEKESYKPRHWPLIIFAFAVTALFLAAIVTTFSSFGLQLLTQIIEWFQAIGIV